MKVSVPALLAVILLLAPSAALAQSAGPPGTPSPEGTFSISDVGFDPHLAAQVPLALAFRDETGKTVRLADYVHDRPVILSLNDFTCQDLCPLELQNLVDTMDQLPPFASEFKVNYPLLVGQDHEDLLDAFGAVVAIPVTVVIGRDGSICDRHMGLVDLEQVEREIKALL